MVGKKTPKKRAGRKNGNGGDSPERESERARGGRRGEGREHEKFKTARGRDLMNCLLSDY